LITAADCPGFRGELGDRLRRCGNGDAPWTVSIIVMSNPVMFAGFYSTARISHRHRAVN
jgi:hypothetical protein